MNITLVTFDLDCGGVQRVVANMTKELADRGHNVSVITQTDSRPDFFALDGRASRVRMTHAGWSTDRPRARPRLRNPCRRWSRMRDLRRAIVNTRPDVVISYEDVLNVGVVVSLLGTQIPVVVTEHCDPRHHRIPVLWHCLRPWMYRKASAVVVLNDSIREWCLKHWPGCHIVTIPNAISLERPARSVARLATGGEHVLLAMGRLVRAKGFDLLVEAFAQISAECAAWRLVILGDGPERPALEQSIRRLRLVDRVTLPGAVSTPETFMASAELFVVSSRYEGFCLALVEAMASGIPVVSFACPSGPPAIIRQGIDGVLVPPEDVPALANALRDLMLDRSRRDELRNAALKAAQCFEASRIMPTWCRLISDVVAASSRS